MAEILAGGCGGVRGEVFGRKASGDDVDAIGAREKTGGSARTKRPGPIRRATRDASDASDAEAACDSKQATSETASRHRRAAP